MTEYVKGLITGLLVGPLVVLLAVPWLIQLYILYLEKVLGKEDKR